MVATVEAGLNDVDLTAWFCQGNHDSVVGYAQINSLCTPDAVTIVENRWSKASTGGVSIRKNIYGLAIFIQWIK